LMLTCFVVTTSNPEESHEKGTANVFVIIPIDYTPARGAQWNNDSSPISVPAFTSFPDVPRPASSVINLQSS